MFNASAGPQWLVAVFMASLTASGMADVATKPTRSYGLGDLRTVALSPDHRRLITAGQTGAFVWDYESGEVLHRMEEHRVAVHAVAFSPDGRQFLTGGRDGTIWLWETETGKPVRSFEGHQWEITGFDFTSDGKSFVSSSVDNSAKIWLVESGEFLGEVVVPGNSINRALFTPDGTHLVTADSSMTNNVGVWNLATGERIRSLGEHSGQIYALAFLGNSLLAAGGDDKRVRLWNFETGERIRTLEGATGFVIDLASRTNEPTLVAGCHDGQVIAWDATTGDVLQNLKFPPLAGLDGLPDASPVVIGSTDNLVRVVDPFTGSVEKTFEGHATSTMTGVAFSPDGQHVLSGGSEIATRLWERRNGVLARTFNGHGAGTSAVAFSPDGSRVLTTIGFPQKAARLWRADTGQIEREFLGHTSWLMAAIFSADGDRVVTGAWDGTVRLWETATGVSLRTFTGHTGGVYSVAMSPDGALVAGGGGTFDPTARVWNAQSGAVVRVLSEEAGTVKALAFSPSGRELLVAWEGGLLRLFDTTSWEMRKEIVVPTGFLNAAVFSPDGEHVLTGDGWPFFTARLWDATSGEEVRIFAGHTAPVNAVAFSPDGNWVLTGGDNVRLWGITDLRARLRMTRTDGGLELSWELGQLEQAAMVSGPWSPVPGAVSPMTVPMDRMAAFFRVAVPAEE